MTAQPLNDLTDLERAVVRAAYGIDSPAYRWRQRPHLKELAATFNLSTDAVKRTLKAAIAKLNKMLTEETNAYAHEDNLG